MVVLFIRHFITLYDIHIFKPEYIFLQYKKDVPPLPKLHHKFKAHSYTTVANEKHFYHIFKTP